MESLFSVSLLDISFIGFQSQMFWDLVSPLQISKVEVPDMEHKPLTHEGEAPYM